MIVGKLGLVLYFRGEDLNKRKIGRMIKMLVNRPYLLSKEWNDLIGNDLVEKTEHCLSDWIRNLSRESQQMLASELKQCCFGRYRPKFPLSLSPRRMNLPWLYCQKLV